MREERSPSRLWFPFTATELQVSLAVFGFAAAALAYAGVDGRYLAAAAGGFIVVTYLAGLLVYARRHARRFRFVPDGGVRGEGYLPLFRRARRSILLMHVDDDTPSEELVGLYRSLLERGVRMRRTVVVRPEGDPLGYAWVAEFGNHPNLQQRVLPPQGAALMRFSFVIVDEELVAMSVPGYAAIDAKSYSPGLLLRHLVVLDDRDAAAVFMRLHEELWMAAVPLRNAKDLADPEALARVLYADELPAA
jgi:hypothetical protein